MPYNDSHHVVKTSAQWDERAIEFWVVPRGCLCVELTPEGKTKIKIGEGNKFYSQLPYVNDISDLENYYTKEEVDNIVTNINLMAIRSTDEYDTKNDLPSIGNKLGDVRFVKSQSPSIKTDPDIYLWNGSRWIYVGYELQDIDLSQYLKKEEFHELFDPVREKVEEMYPKMHTHDNKSILDRIQEPYTTPEKEKLAGLHNYDDTEIRELIAETGHTHPNKPILDTITDDSLWSESDRDKFESLHNYDDTGVKNRLTDLEDVAHTHDNKNILDQVTAAFTVEDKTKLDSLHNNEVFIGTDGMYGGREGLVPAPTIIDAGKFLCADGTWRAAGEIVYDFRGATASEDGTNGLVPAPMAGEQSYYLKGDGTWAKIKQGGDKYKAGDGIFILSGEVVSDAFPFKVYSKSGHLSQYIIYGNTGGVGESMGGGVYGVNISVTDEHGNISNTSIILPEKISFGDYIDYERQVFVHMRTNVSSLINTVDSNYSYRWAIRSNGNISPTDIGAYGSSPQVTTLAELEPGTTYELYHACTYPAFSNYMNLNVYDTEQNRTRTMNFYDSTGNVPTIIALASNEKYIRLTYEHGGSYPYTLIKVKAVETPTTLPQIPLFPNSINTINVTNTIKPAEIYVEVAEPSEDDPDDPMSDFTGIIYNDGVLDITQEDPNNLNELTVHFRDDVDKTITIPSASVMEGATDQTDGEEGLVPAPLAGDENKFLRGDGTWAETNLPIASDTTLGGIKVGNNLTIDPVTGVLEATSGGTTYVEGDGIEFGYPVLETYQVLDKIRKPSGTTLTTDVMPSGTVDFFCDLKYYKYSGNSFLILCYDGERGSFCYTPAPTASGGWARMWIYTAHENWYDLYLNGSFASSSPIVAHLRWGNTMSMSFDHTSTSAQNTPGVLPGHNRFKFDTSSDADLYWAKFYENSALVGELVPVIRQSDNVVGLFNKVTETFSTVSGLTPGTPTGETIVIYDQSSTQNIPINAKLGTGLSFDSNDAIEVDSMVGATSQTAGTGGAVPAPSAGDETKFLRGDGSWAEVDAATNYVEGNAIEFGHPGMTDLGFDFDAFVSKFTPPNNGTVSVDSVNKSFTLTATGSDAYTNPWAGGDLYTIPVVGGRKYRLTWNSNAPTVGGNVYAFENANTSHMHGVNQKNQSYLEFTADTTSNVNFRFGVSNSGDTITYSNIKFYEVDNADPDTNIINVKYGSGLSLDNSNRLQANTMTGADGTNAGTAGIVPAPTATDNTKFLKGNGTWASPPSYTLPAATASTLGGVKVGAGLSMNANDELGVTSPYVTSVANQGSTPGVITVAKSDGTSSDVDVLESLRLILNCNFDSSRIRNPLGEPVNAPSSGDTIGSAIMGDLTVLEVNE